MGSKGSQQVTSSTNTTKQSYDPNPAIAAAGTQALTGAQSAASSPFSMPVAPVAGFNPFQNQYFGQIQNVQGMTNPYFSAATDYLRQSAAPVTGADVANYYNPMAASVFANLNDVFGQQRSQNTANAIRNAGGVGADRIGVAQAELAKQQGLVAGQTAAGLYQPALQAAMQQKQMQAGAGYGIGQLGPAAQAAALQATGALGTAGGQQQQQTQAELNAPYQNTLAQIAYPFQTSQYLAGITGGLAPAFGGTTTGQTNQTQTTTYPSPSPLSQAIGLGTSALGMFGGFGGFGALGGAMGKGAGAAPTFMSGASSVGGPGLNPWQLYRRGGTINKASGGASYGNLAGRFGMGDKSGNPYAIDLTPQADGSWGLESTGGAVGPYNMMQGYDDGGEVASFDDRFSPSDVIPQVAPPIAGETPQSALTGAFKALGQEPLGPSVWGQYDRSQPPYPPAADVPPNANPTGYQPPVQPIPNAQPGDMNRYMMPRNQMPYPDATDRDWGQNLARSPWLSLVKAGAAMASTPGPIGTAIAKGLSAGADELQSQRKSLQSEEGVNQRAQQLYQQAQQHLDQYSRMTPYQQALLESGKGNWKIAGIGADGNPIMLNAKTGETMAAPDKFAPTTGGTAIQRNAQWMVENKIAPDLRTAYSMLSHGVNEAGTYSRLVQAEKKILLGTPQGVGMAPDDLEKTARANVDARFGAAHGQQGTAPIQTAPQPVPKVVVQNGHRFQVNPDGSYTDLGPVK